jgi:ribonuclease HII
MFIYAGIDEAGYGPFFGPLLVGRAIFAIDTPPPDNRDDATPADLRTSNTPDLWRLLSKAVCRKLSEHRTRIPINDSKKIHPTGSGVTHLEPGVLAFATLAGFQPTHVADWLTWIGNHHHRDLSALPWYAPTHDHPWAPLPTTMTAPQLAINRNQLASAATAAGVQTLDIAATVLFEDRFNEMVAATRSKSAASFTFVAAHLAAVWEKFGSHRPTVVVDRQSGRMRYRELLALTFPSAHMTILDESESISSYRIDSPATRPDLKSPDPNPQSMTVHFQVQADSFHFPVALASMVSKYTRELLMARFQAWFSRHAPEIKPTAGYGSDAKRFWREVQPILPRLDVDPRILLRSR